MNPFSDFKSVDNYFDKNKKSGKIIDHVHFISSFDINQEIAAGSIALFSVQNHELAEITDTFPIQIRKSFYDLFVPSAGRFNILDFGIIYNDEKGSNSLVEAINLLSSKKITTIILSSKKNINTLLYKGLEKSLKSISISEASTLLPFDEKNTKNHLNSSWLKKVISDPDNKLFNFSNIGMQGFLNSVKSQDLFRKLLFDTYRMGTLQQDFILAEPVIRDSDLFSFNLNSIKASDAPAVSYPNPNGFGGFEACRLSRFAGTSERLKLFCIDNLPELDDGAKLSSFLVAQMLWFFTEALSVKTYEIPRTNNKDFNVFVVETEHEGTFSFLQSRITDRWWVQIEKINGKKMTVSCLKNDYLDMTLGEIPERMMKFINKIS